MEQRGKTLLLLFFFLSGACGLIYEVVWTRMLTLVIGNTVFSVTTVLTAFMGGLALGSYLAGRLIDRRYNPLKAYGWLEGAIGLYCLLIPWLIEALVPLYRFLYLSFQDSFYALSLMRFLVCGSLLLVPTTLMGATLPILSKSLVGRMDRLGREIGRLYALNTFGAVLGSFGTGFFLIPALGIRSTILLAAAVNLGIALAVLLLARSPHRGGEASQEAPEERAPKKKKKPVAEPVQEVPAITPSPIELRLLLWGLGVSGFAAMVYQISWTRVLSLAIGSSTYAFCLILTAFICGLALGSLLFSWFLDRWKALTLLFGLTEVAIGVTALLIVPALGRLPIYIVGVIQTYASSFAQLQGIEFGLTFLLVLVPTLLLGVTFPLVSKVYTTGLEVIGRSVGNVYAVNTLGAILGSFCGGFLMLPWLGIQGSIMAAAALNLLVGGLVCLGSPSLSRLQRGAVGGIALALVPLAFFLIPSWDRHILNSGSYLYADIYEPESNASQVQKAMRSQGQLLYYREGVSATVSVLRRAVDQSLTLQINGKVDASTRRRDMPTQLVSGHLPLLLHPKPQEVLLIGLGSGVTLGAAVQHPIRRVDVVEISPEVVEAARYFSVQNHNALAHPRTRLIIGDGRNHVLLGDARYDVIISEPSNLWIAGMAHLFTQDFYQLARERLRPGGVMCQWIQGYLMASNDFKSLVRTFLQAFPRASLWEVSVGGDYLLIGMRDGWSQGYRSLRARAGSPGIREDLGFVGLVDPVDLLGLFVMNER
ncbi:MAG: fused MFS/spermidine synthase, partial [Candidatus Tectomicrobia bacterium]|nr:fused MFS/spermidine synthase [Candidatus Tectomicrobia bacterium]